MRQKSHYPAVPGVPLRVSWYRTVQVFCNTPWGCVTSTQALITAQVSQSPEGQSGTARTADIGDDIEG